MAYRSALDQLETRPLETFPAAMEACPSADRMLIAAALRIVILGAKASATSRPPNGNPDFAWRGDSQASLDTATDDLPGEGFRLQLELPLPGPDKLMGTEDD